MEVFPDHRLRRTNRTRQSIGVSFVAASAFAASAWAQGGIQYDKIEIKTDKVASNLYMLSGSEGVVIETPPTKEPGVPPAPRMSSPGARQPLKR